MTSDVSAPISISTLPLTPEVSHVFPQWMSHFQHRPTDDSTDVSRSHPCAKVSVCPADLTTTTSHRTRSGHESSTHPTQPAQVVLLMRLTRLQFLKLSSPTRSTRLPPISVLPYRLVSPSHLPMFPTPFAATRGSD